MIYKIILLFTIFLFFGCGAVVSSENSDTSFTYLPMIIKAEPTPTPTPTPTPAPTSTPTPIPTLSASRVEIIQVYSPFGDNRTIRIYIPEGYDNTDKRYPVMYLTDGQLFINNISASFIVVGIDSIHQVSSRFDELSPWVNYEIDKWYGVYSPQGGRGDEFLSFVINIKNVIDSRYKTMPDRSNTAIAGASMGGLFSVYAGIERRDIFSKVISISPAVWFGSRDINNWLSNNNMIDYIIATSHNGVDFWIYVGGNESHGTAPTIPNFIPIYIDGAYRIHNLLGGNITFNPIGEHDVATFLQYLPEGINWLGW